MLFRYMLRREGLEPEVDVKIVPVGGSSERAAAVMAGQVQATVTFVDNWFAMEEQGADVQLLGYFANLMHQSGELEEPLDAAAFVDSSYLEKAAEMGCGTD